jgi:hypothetical protein
MYSRMYGTPKSVACEEIKLRTVHRAADNAVSVSDHVTPDVWIFGGQMIVNGFEVKVRKWDLPGGGGFRLTPKALS